VLGKYIQELDEKLDPKAAAGKPLRGSPLAGPRQAG
jgi:hypothetical protein